MTDDETDELVKARVRAALARRRTRRQTHPADTSPARTQRPLRQDPQQHREAGARTMTTRGMTLTGTPASPHHAAGAAANADHTDDATDTREHEPASSTTCSDVELQPVEHERTPEKFRTLHPP